MDGGSEKDSVLALQKELESRDLKIKNLELEESDQFLELKRQIKAT